MALTSLLKKWKGMSIKKQSLHLSVSDDMNDINDIDDRIWRFLSQIPVNPESTPPRECGPRVRRSALGLTYGIC